MRFVAPAADSALSMPQKRKTLSLVRKLQWLSCHRLSTNELVTMSNMFLPVADSPKQKVITILPRHRKLLHHLLHGETGKCSNASMEMFQRFGWVYNPDGCYQLTQKGRYLAEISETTPPGRKLELLSP